MDKIRAVIVYDTGSGRVTGYSLGGRRDIEAGVRAILKPLDSWGATNHTADASFGTDNFDFLLEGVPTLVGESGNFELSGELPRCIRHIRQSGPSRTKTQHGAGGIDGVGSSGSRGSRSASASPALKWKPSSRYGSGPANEGVGLLGRLAKRNARPPALTAIIMM